jgi:adenosylcobinamide-GDP ribazoletransferase
MPARHRSWWRDLRLALGFMTRLPVGVIEGDLAAASWAFPLAGLLVGGGAALIYGFAIDLGLSALIAAALAVAGAMLLTGALHEDGLADFADGLGVRGGPAERLAAMRASGIGSFGTLALIFCVLLRVAALAALVGPAAVGPALIGAHAGARALLPWALHGQPRARADGLAVGAGRPTSAVAGVALLIGLAILLLAAGPVRGAITGLAALLGLLIMPLARRRLGGITGDVLGAVEQVSEIAILLALVATRSLVGR